MIRGRYIRRAILAAAVLLLGSGGEPLNAQAPPIGKIYPPGGQQGTEFELTTTGKSGKLPVTVHCDSKGIKIVQSDDPKKQESYRVSIAPDAVPGPHLLWFRNSDGVAGPQHFLVGRHPELREKEPNNSHSQAQTIDSLPVTINGKLEKSEDVDSFRIDVKAPCWLIASARAYGIDSPIDPLLHLRDEHGQRVAFAHDGGHRLDPLLAWKVDRPGSYTIELAGFAYPPASSIRFTGSASCIYRLTISTGPWIHSVQPLALGKSETAFKIHGWNAEASTITLPATSSGPPRLVGVTKPPFENTFAIAVSQLAELVEETPHQAIAVPSALTGILSQEGEVDRFTFSATKGKKLRFEAHSAALEFPVDPVLRIETAEGKELARADDSDNKKRSGQDPVLEWSAKDDGKYVVAVSDLLERGGERCLYRLVTREAGPDFSASTASFGLVVEAGKTAELKVSASRINGYKGKLKIAMEGLPSGLKMEGGEVPDKSGEVTLKITADSDAMPWQGCLPLKILEMEASNPKGKDVVVNLKGATTDAGDLLINESRGLWLTVKKPAAK